MRKILITGATALVIAVSSTSANAEDNRDYISTSVGLTNMWDNSVSNSAVDYENGYNMNVGFGYDWDYQDSIRPEIEISYREADLDNVSGEVTNYAAMANFYYDHKNDSKYTPYIGVGAGVAYVDAESTTFNDDDTVFAYQGMLGASYAHTDDMDITIGYKYFNNLDADINGVGEDIESNNVELGVRFKY
jgi:opacity protein-like surface antigen